MIRNPIYFHHTTPQTTLQQFPHPFCLANKKLTKETDHQIIRSSVFSPDPKWNHHTFISNSTPNQRPLAKSVLPTKRTVPSKAFQMLGFPVVHKGVVVQVGSFCSASFLSGVRNFVEKLGDESWTKNKSPRNHHQEKRPSYILK